MTYGDKIRQMDDCQLAVLLDMVQCDGFELCEGISVRTFASCEFVSDWLDLIQREVPDGAPRYGIM